MIGKIAHGLFRRRIRFFLYPIFIFSCIFIIYQFIIFGQLNQSNNRSNEVKTEEPVAGSVKGAHQKNWIFYTKREDNTFRCIQSMEIIDYNQINDNYCDCSDGTDEPGTNACPNGEFYCKKKSSMRLPSNRVNDGICDCCDGSDEWQSRHRNDLNDKQQVALGRFLAPCPIRC